MGVNRGGEITEPLVFRGQRCPHNRLDSRRRRNVQQFEHRKK